MSVALKQAEWISPEEYLEGERLSNIRHEYVDGRVYAMAGASADHNRIAGNIFRELSNALRGKRCEPFINDMKVKIPPSVADAFYYPDVIVVCEPADDAKYFRELPTVIFEVLSPDTQRTDEQEKAIAYRHIPTLQIYLLVEQEQLKITMLHRGETGWRRETLAGRETVLILDCLGVQIPFERIYERTSVWQTHPPA